MIDNEERGKLIINMVAKKLTSLKPITELMIYENRRGKLLLSAVSLIVAKLRTFDFLLGFLLFLEFALGFVKVHVWVVFKELLEVT